MTIYRLPFGHAAWPDGDFSPRAGEQRLGAGVPEPTTRVAVRIPDTLRQRVEASAELEGVDATTWIVRALARSVDPRLTTS
jgi:hypothetical protein